MGNFRKQFRRSVYAGLVSLFLLGGTFSGFAQNKKEERIKMNKEFNERCFTCHKNAMYQFYNPEQDKMMKEHMASDKVINKELYYESNHYSFSCADCHSDEYDSFPHPTNLRMEEKYACIDCHGGDETYAHYQFEAIEEEFINSMHSSKHSDEFTCWMCHDAHTYKISARSDQKIKEIIEYDNLICLSCHADNYKYELIGDAVNADIIDKHDWLPNQALHFRNVRCIECHTLVNDDVLIAHLVQPKENAVQNCVECHSANSHLMSSLYKFRAKETRSDVGFMNAVFLNESFVIGANRNVILNKTSMGIFIFSLVAITLHFILRLITKK
ncbi:MAG: hypothetical protein HN921_18050 [Bacteroidetes bacterium]|nr:hypothetical protein [Bacteroidota bacterium]